MADEITSGDASETRAELKRALSAAAEKRSQSLAAGADQEEADAALKSEVSTLTISNACQDQCADAWMACIVSGRPQEDCDAEFDACVIACDDTPVIDPNA